MSTVPPSPPCADDADVVAALGPQRRGDAGGDRRGVAEQRVDPRAAATRSPGTGVEKTSRQPVALTAMTWSPVARIAASSA